MGQAPSTPLDQSFGETEQRIQQLGSDVDGFKKQIVSLQASLDECEGRKAAEDPASVTAPPAAPQELELEQEQSDLAQSKEEEEEKERDPINKQPTTGPFAPAPTSGGGAFGGKEDNTESLAAPIVAGVLVVALSAFMQ